MTYTSIILIFQKIIIMSTEEIKRYGLNSITLIDSNTYFQENNN